jgi:ABC-2 type transport system ATP-binding protein
MDEADRCDRVAMLDRGRVVAMGRPAELKSRIGGDCITLETTEAQSLRTEIQRQFGLEATVVDSTVRIEASPGGPLAARLLETFGANVQSVTISRPTLEDVFLHAAGHAFERGAS